jgi:hypothetical protein
VGTGWSWLRIGIGTCEYGKELSGSIKMRGISRPVAKTGQLFKKDSAAWSKYVSKLHI